MDQRSLFEASMLGDVDSLHQLLKNNPLILNQVYAAHSAENTPLHVASLAGHIDFVRQVLHHMPSFAKDLNKDGFAPVHLAAVAGHLAVVNALLKEIGDGQCLLRDKGGRTALHYAAIRGRVEIIEEILMRCPEAIEQVTVLGETALLLAVKNCQFEAFRVLFEASEKYGDGKHGERMNAKDKQENVILELASATNQLQVIDFLEQRHERTHQEITILNIPTGENQRKDQDPAVKIKTYLSSIYGKDITPIVATLIAGATYTVGVNPPPTIWKEGTTIDNTCLIQWLNMNYHKKDDNLFQSCAAIRFYCFMICNAVSFLASIFLLINYRSRRIAPFLVFLSLGSMFGTYVTSATAISPSPIFTDFVKVFFGVGILGFLMPVFVAVVSGLLKKKMTCLFRS